MPLPSPVFGLRSGSSKSSKRVDAHSYRRHLFFPSFSRLLPTARCLFRRMLPTVEARYIPVHRLTVADRLEENPESDSCHETATNNLSELLTVQDSARGGDRYAVDQSRSRR